MGTVTKLFVGGLSEDVTSQELKRRFASFGEVQEVHLAPDKLDPGKCRGFGHVTLKATQAQLEKCIKSLNGTKWKGKTLRVEPAKPDPAAKHRVSAATKEKEREQEEKHEQEGENKQKKKSKKKVTSPGAEPDVAFSDSVSAAEAQEAKRAEERKAKEKEKKKRKRKESAAATEPAEQEAQDEAQTGAATEDGAKAQKKRKRAMRETEAEGKAAPVEEAEADVRETGGGEDEEGSNNSFEADEELRRKLKEETSSLMSVLEQVVPQDEANDPDKAVTILKTKKRKTDTARDDEHDRKRQRKRARREQAGEAGAAGEQEGSEEQDPAVAEEPPQLPQYYVNPKAFGANAPLPAVAPGQGEQQDEGGVNAQESGAKRSGVATSSSRGGGSVLDVLLSRSSQQAAQGVRLSTAPVKLKQVLSQGQGQGQGQQKAGGQRNGKSKGKGRKQAAAGAGAAGKSAGVLPETCNFMRTASEEQVQQDWLATRRDVTFDVKRKRQMAQRKKRSMFNAGAGRRKAR